MLNDLICPLFRLDKPCEDCSRVYGYRNHMSLSINTSKFSHEVEESKTSGNIDGPEGGFDAIMQSIVCKDIIGWRRDARKLLIFTTDADFHSAGDGRVRKIMIENLIGNLIQFFTNSSSNFLVGGYLGA